MSNVTYTFWDDGKTGCGTLPDGKQFLFDADKIDLIKDVKFYYCQFGKGAVQSYIQSREGRMLHDYLFPHRDGYEIDHIDLNTLDNRSSNIRYCTHQQNQINQPLQRNNTSGVTGVSYYLPRHKFRARVKICQHDIHLGYYQTFDEAVMARDVGMMCMFGEYGRYNDVGPIPEWIYTQVVEKCLRFAELSACEAFLDYAMQRAA